MIKNRLYQNQFYLLAFISITTFKLALLPSMLSEYSNRSEIYIILAMMIIEVFMLKIVYGIVSHNSLLDMQIPNAIKSIALILILFSIGTKLIIYNIEGCVYVREYIFDKPSLAYILIPTIAAIGYIGYKGITNIARSTEIVFWFLFISFIFSVLFAKLDLKAENYSNIKLNEDSFVGLDKYWIWFGDFTPFLLITVVKPQKKSIFQSMILVAIVIVPIVVMVLLVGIYGSAVKDIGYAFSRLAIYNRVSYLLGYFDIPTTVSFLLSMIIKLSLLFASVVDIICYFVNKRKIVSICVSIIVFTLNLFVINSIDSMKKLATSVIRYVVTIIEYLVPMAIFIFMRVYKLDTPAKTSRLYEDIYEK